MQKELIFFKNCLDFWGRINIIDIFCLNSYQIFNGIKSLTSKQALIHLLSPTQYE